MDMITESLLSDFSKDQEMGGIDKDERFEHFAAYITIKRQHNETFDTFDVVTGKGDDTGIDAFAALVNGNLVADVLEFEDLATTTSFLDVTFVFVQAAQTAGFDG